MRGDGRSWLHRGGMWRVGRQRGLLVLGLLATTEQGEGV